MTKIGWKEGNDSVPKNLWRVCPEVLQEREKKQKNSYYIILNSPVKLRRINNEKTSTSIGMLRSTPSKEMIAKPEGNSYNSMVEESLIFFFLSDDKPKIIPAEKPSKVSKWD